MTQVPSSEELHRLLGDIDDVRRMAIVALNPTLAELEHAVAWADGASDSRRPHESKIGAIFDILSADDEEP